MNQTFKTPKMRLFLLFWRVLWFVGMPVILTYLWLRSKNDKDYIRYLAERFGFHARRETHHIWIHAVSLGELKSAEPLIRSYLKEGFSVVTTHFTPAGRRASRQLFASEIASGQLSAVWVPFDYGAAFRRFFRAFRPQFGLVMEVEMWPGMIAASAGQNVPLFLCNGQYPTRSFKKDEGAFLSRRDIVSGFTGVMVKNNVQAERFADLGQANIAITGEMRFEVAINRKQLEAAEAHRNHFDGGTVTAFTSVVEGEDSILIEAIKSNNHRVIYVPRAPERFDQTYELLCGAGLRVVRRSELLDATLNPTEAWSEDWDVLLGDSIGEMTYYLGLSDRAVIGGGFVPKGSHNIIEPLVLGKPVIVGPNVWTIEFPVEEALDAGVALQVDGDKLVEALSDAVIDASISEFLSQHGGSVAKTHAALAQFGMRPVK